MGTAPRASTWSGPSSVRWLRAATPPSNSWWQWRSGLQRQQKRKGRGLEPIHITSAGHLQEENQSSLIGRLLCECRWSMPPTASMSNAPKLGYRYWLRMSPFCFCAYPAQHLKLCDTQSSVFTCKRMPRVTPAGILRKERKCAFTISQPCSPGGARTSVST